MRQPCPPGVRMLSIRRPSASSTACASFVGMAAAAPACHVSPRSSLK